MMNQLYIDYQNYLKTNTSNPLSLIGFFNQINGQAGSGQTLSNANTGQNKPIVLPYSFIDLFEASFFFPEGWIFWALIILVVWMVKE